MPDQHLTHRNLERSLLQLAVGTVANVHGSRVQRVTDWSWCVGGGEERLLLPAMDEVAAQGGFRVVAYR